MIPTSRDIWTIVETLLAHARSYQKPKTHARSYQESKTQMTLVLVSRSGVSAFHGPKIESTATRDLCSQPPSSAGGR